MALTDENGMIMPVAPMSGGYGNYGFGSGDGAFWLIILFLFAFMGNGFGGNGNMQRGFDQQSVMSGIGSLQNSIGNGFSNAEVSRCNTQANILQGMNVLNSGIQDLKYTIATENCTDRAAVSDALRDVIASNNAGVQRILDQMCQDKIDAKDEIIANLRTQLNMANLASSQTAQTAKILADNAAQTLALEQYLNPTPIPAYMVQNPNCCNGMYNGCGSIG